MLRLEFETNLGKLIANGNRLDARGVCKIQFQTIWLFDCLCSLNESVETSRQL